MASSSRSGIPMLHLVARRTSSGISFKMTGTSKKEIEFSTLGELTFSWWEASDTPGLIEFVISGAIKVRRRPTTPGILSPPSKPSATSE